QRIAELLDQVKAVPVTGDDQRIRGLVDHGVNAGAAVRTPDVVFAQGQPVVPVHLTRRHPTDLVHAPSIAERDMGNLTIVLLDSLNPAAVAGGADIGDAVRIGGSTLSRSDVVGAATSVAERVAAADRVAVLATPSPTTVLAIAGCLIAGVPVVPVPADVGAAERHHIVTDSGAQAWLGEK